MRLNLESEGNNRLSRADIIGYFSTYHHAVGFWLVLVNLRAYIVRGHEEEHVASYLQSLSKRQLIPALFLVKTKLQRWKDKRNLFERENRKVSVRE